MTVVSPGADGVPLSGARSTRRGEATFRGLTMGAGIFVFVILAAIAAFLIVKALPAFEHDKSSFWTTQTWEPDASGRFGIAALVFGTVLSSLLALLMAVPVPAALGALPAVG